MVEIIAISFTETARSRFSLVLAVVNWVYILTSLGLAGIGAHVRLTVDEYTNLVENYDNKTMPFLLVGVGLFSAVVSSVGGILLYLVSDPGKRKTCRHFLLVHLILSLFVSLAVLACGAMTFIHITHLRDSFEGGITAAMKKYGQGSNGTTSQVKTEVDLLQMKFRCCGNDRYQDWFHVPWVPKDYIEAEDNADLSQAKYEGVDGLEFHADSVPFSCCNPQSMRPCVHHRVHTNTRHFNYDYLTDNTLNQMGCREALMDYFGDDILTDCGAFILAMYILQVIVVLLTRYLQTSIVTALESGDPAAPSKGYLFSCGAKKEEADHPLPSAKDLDGSYHDDSSFDHHSRTPLVPGMGSRASQGSKRSLGPAPSQRSHGSFRPVPSKNSHDSLRSGYMGMGAGSGYMNDVNRQSGQSGGWSSGGSVPNFVPIPPPPGIPLPPPPPPLGGFR